MLSTVVLFAVCFIVAIAIIAYCVAMVRNAMVANLGNLFASPATDRALARFSDRALAYNVERLAVKAYSKVRG